MGTLGGVVWVGIQVGFFFEIKREFPKMRRALDLISEALFMKNIVSEKAYISASSPIHLTDDGQMMLRESGFHEFFDANKDWLFYEIDRTNPKAPFDVEAAARHIMLLHFNLEKAREVEKVKNYAYQNGVPLVNILFAYSVAIRDMYLHEKSSSTAVPA